MFDHALDERTKLQLLLECHAEELFALVDANRTQLRQWLPWVDRNRTPDDSRVFIRSVLQQLSENRGFSVAIMSDGKIAGMVGFHTLDRANGFVRLGYWLGSEYQGRGLMTRSCQALTTYAFSEMRLNKVEIDPAPENRKSRAIPERLGFTQEGILREVEWLYDHYVDHIVYGMLAREWTGEALSQG